MNVVYIDFNEIELRSGTYVTAVTWMLTNWLTEDRYSCHHYFINYPGVKDSERLLADVVGGKALVRYSLPTVLTVLKSSIPDDAVLAVEDSTRKSKLKKYAKEAGVELSPLATFSDLSMTTGDIVDIKQRFEDVRNEAAQKFGNSL